MTESETYPENPTPTSTPERADISRGEQFSLDLDKVNAAILSMLADPTTGAVVLREAWGVRAVLAEDFVDSLEPTPNNPNPRPRVQFDIMADEALIFEKLGNTLLYLSKLDTAEGFALNHHLDDVVGSSISDEIDSKIGELDDSAEALVLKLRSHVSYENREFLRDLIRDGTDFEDLVGNIYGMILDEGGDPNEVFVSLGILEL